MRLTPKNRIKSLNLSLKFKCMKNLYSLVIAVFFVQLAFGQLEITDPALAVNADNAVTIDFTAQTSEAARMYVEFFPTADPADVRITRISNFSSFHNIPLIGLEPNTEYSATAYAFNETGEVNEDAGTETTGSINDILGNITIDTGSPNFNDFLLLVTDNKMPGERDTAIAVNANGDIVWAKTDLPFVTEAGCNNINFKDGTLLYSDCHNIYTEGFDGRNEEFYEVGLDKYLHDGLFFNQNGNIVALYAGISVVDKSLIGGNEFQPVVSDYIIEIEPEFGGVVYQWSPFDHFNPFQQVAPDGEWTSILGFGTEHWKLSNGLTQDDDSNYILTHYIDNQMAKISSLNGNILWTMGQGYTSIQVMPEDQFYTPRSFEVLENGRFFVFGEDENGLSRSQEVFVDAGYQYGMMMVFKDYDLPAGAEQAGIGSAIKLENQSDDQSIMAVGNSVYAVSDDEASVDENTENDILDYSMTFGRDMKVVGLVENFYPMLTADDVSVTADDALVCAGSTESVELFLEPSGGYLTGEGVDGLSFNPEGLADGAYDVTYTYGYVSNTFTFNVETCVSIDDLEAQGGLNIEMYPNPVNDMAVVRYEMLDAGDVQVEVYNMMGNLMQTTDLGFQNKGLNKSDLNVSALENGVYVYKVICGDMSQQSRFVVTR